MNSSLSFSFIFQIRQTLQINKENKHINIKLEMRNKSSYKLWMSPWQNISNKNNFSFLSKIIVEQLGQLVAKVAEFVFISRRTNTRGA